MSVAERAVAVPSAADLERAADMVRSLLPATPVVETTAGPGGMLKLECFQPTGSFKVRGALAALGALDGAARAAGVVTASAGNHALGVAYAATRLGVTATVVVPTTASPAKVRALRGFPIRLVQHGPDFDAAERHALELAGQGPTYVSAYNDTAVIAGQASIARELREQVEGPLTIVTPVGGGGLAAGLSLAAAGRGDLRVVGVEAQASRAVSAAVAAGRVVPVHVDTTLADGLAGNIEAGSITPAIIAEHAHALTHVTESEIQDAIRFLASEHGLLVEGSGAVAVAALLAGRVEPAGRAVALVTGRNVALPVLARVLAAQDSADPAM